MCGRYVLVMGEDGIAQLIRGQDISRDWMGRLTDEGRILETSFTERPGFVGERPGFASYNIAPTQRAPIVVDRQGTRQLELARWGFVPGWWKEPGPPKFTTFNARDDKLKTSGFWRGAINKNRCLIPASGFYEWKKRGKERLPFYIHRTDGRMMAFAGLYSFQTDPESGETSTTFTILTTATNRFMVPLHDRIPLVLGDVEDELWSVWLDPRTKFDDVDRYVESREWPEMSMNRVSTDVNTTGKANYANDPHLIEPLAQVAEDE
jgi:putative SOS response-associated peptidase YedK